MCRVNEESTASETDLASGRGKRPSFPRFQTMEKKGESTFSDCSQLHLFMQPNLYIQ